MSRLDYYDGGRLVRVPEPGRTLAAFEDILSSLPGEDEDESETPDERDQRLREEDDDRRFEAWREACHDARKEER